MLVGVGIMLCLISVGSLVSAGLFDAVPNRRPGNWKTKAEAPKEYRNHQIFFSGLAVVGCVFLLTGLILPS